MKSWIFIFAEIVVVFAFNWWEAPSHISEHREHHHSTHPIEMHP